MPFIGPEQPARLPVLNPDPTGTYTNSTITVNERGMVTSAISGPDPAEVYYGFEVLYTAPAGTNVIDLGSIVPGLEHFTDEVGDIRFAVALATGGGTYNLGTL